MGLVCFRARVTCFTPSHGLFTLLERLTGQGLESQLRVRLIDPVLQRRSHHTIDFTYFGQNVERLDAQAVPAHLVVVRCPGRPGGVNTLLARRPQQASAHRSQSRPPGCRSSSSPIGISTAQTADVGSRARSGQTWRIPSPGAHGRYGRAGAPGHYHLHDIHPHPGKHHASALLGGGISPCASGLESNALMRSIISL